MKSRLLAAFAIFIVSFGGALAVVSPAEAAPGDCFVEVTSSTSTPAYNPTPCPAPPVTVTVTVRVTVPGPTVVVTKVVTKTVHVTDIRTVVQSASIAPSPSSVVTPVVVSNGGSSWTLVSGILIALGLVLLVVVVVGLLGRLRYKGTHSRSDDYTVADYRPLGGYAGQTHLDEETIEMPRVKTEKP